MPNPLVSRPFHDSSGLLHHVELCVSDLRASTEFYDWLLTELGYARHQQWDHGVSWKRRETSIVLVQADADDGQEPLPSGRGPGLNRLAFHARSRRQVDDVTRELRRRGAALLYDDHPVNAGVAPYAVSFEDPDRIRIELVAPD